MFTIILGAGVNKEINSRIDLGSELFQNILNRVTDRTSPGKEYLSSRLDSVLGIKLSVRQAFVDHMSNYAGAGEIKSIDAFLDEINTFPEFEQFRSEFMTIGRVMILAHVLGYEGDVAKSHIRAEIAEKKTWLSVLADFLDRDGRLGGHNVNIVTFNYDRILEYFLVERFNNSIAINDFLRNNLIHVYGSPSQDNIPYGHPNDRLEEISAITNQIRLIHDERQTIAPQLRLIVKQSKKILIMGYGFDPINNRRIGLHELEDSNHVYVNIFPGNNADVSEFSRRRQSVRRVRDVLVDANIRYGACKSFVSSCLD